MAGYLLFDLKCPDCGVENVVVSDPQRPVVGWECGSCNSRSLSSLPTDEVTGLVVSFNA